jgi:thioredoxin 1
MKQLAQADFQKEVLDRKGTVLVDFYADWCGPCRILGPQLESLSEKYTGEDVLFAKVNVDANPNLAAAYGVMSIPTVAIFKDGELKGQMVGVQPTESYRMAIDKASGKAAA